MVQAGLRADHSPFQGRAMKKLFGKTKDFVKSRPKTSIVILIVFIAVFSYANVEVMHYTSEPGFCEMCHPGTGTGALSEVHTWRQNIHSEAGVKCLDCHGEPGLFGYKKAKISGLYDTYVEIFRSEEYKLKILNKAVEDPQYAADLVPSTTCLFCHTDSVNQQIRDERLMAGWVNLRMLDSVENPEFREEKGMSDIFTDELESDVDPGHQRHLEAGLSCMDCHHRMVHGGEYRAQVDLARCNECHSERATEISMSEIIMGEGDAAVEFSHDFHNMIFDCNQCHMDLFPMNAGVTSLSFGDHTEDTACFSCHNGQAASYDCNSCHGQPPMPEEPITYTMDGFDPVDFNHSFHGMAFSCDSCHDDPWTMKAYDTPMTMSQMYRGEFCGSCHNGQDAFAATSCNRCHN